MRGEIEFRGVTLSLDLDDMAVEARVQSTMKGFPAVMKAIDDREGGDTSKALAIVDAIKQCVNTVFGRDDAAEQFFAGITRYSEFMAVQMDLFGAVGAARAAVIHEANEANGEKLSEAQRNSALSQKINSRNKQK